MAGPKINYSDKQEIASLREQGWQIKVIALGFNVNKSSISMICTLMGAVPPVGLRKRNTAATKARDNAKTQQLYYVIRQIKKGKSILTMARRLGVHFTILKMRIARQELRQSLKPNGDTQ